MFDVIREVSITLDGVRIKKGDILIAKNKVSGIVYVLTVDEFFSSYLKCSKFACTTLSSVTLTESTAQFDYSVYQFKIFHSVE